MKRAWRHLFDLLTVLSLLAALWIGAVWASRLLPRDWQIPLSLHWRESNQHALNIDAGFNYIYIDRVEWVRPVVGPRTTNSKAVDAFKQSFASQTSDHDYRGLAFGRHRGPVFMTGSRGRIVMAGNSNSAQIGIGYFVLLFLLLPACRLPTAARWARQRYGRKPGHCPTCGYDLRASNGTCPECGTPAAKV
jgi:hypothetical protein